MTDYRNLIRQANSLAAFGTFRELLTSEDGFRLTTPSKLQLAICCVIDRERIPDELWDDPDVKAAFAHIKPKPKNWEEILILSGIRTGKSLISAAAVVWASQTCGFTPAKGLTLGSGETPRISILSYTRDLANVVFSHIIGNVMASPYLKALVLEDPKSETLLLRHPLGRPVEVKVVAGARAGASLVARWSAGAVFDEAPRMQGEEDGVVNLDDARRAIRFRLLDGARLWYIGSPWHPSGPAYEMREENWGNPRAQVLTIKAPANVMNPVLWTPEKVAERRAQDPELARTEIDADFASPEATLFTPELVSRAVRKEPPILPPVEGQHYVAAMDPATRTNAWVMTIFTRSEGKIRQVGTWEWKPEPGIPLSPKGVMDEIGDICRMYQVVVLKSDQWSADNMSELAFERGIPFMQEDFHGPERARAYIGFARRLEAGMVELCPDPRVFRDLVAVKRRPKANGGVDIVLPTTKDGRHTDQAPPIVMAAVEYMDDPAPVRVQQPRTDEDDDREAEDAEANLIDTLARIDSGDPDADLWLDDAGLDD